MLFVKKNYLIYSTNSLHFKTEFMSLHYTKLYRVSKSFIQVHRIKILPRELHKKWKKYKKFKYTISVTGDLQGEQKDRFHHLPCDSGTIISPFIDWKKVKNFEKYNKYFDIGVSFRYQKPFGTCLQNETRRQGMESVLTYTGPG